MCICSYLGQVCGWGSGDWFPGWLGLRVGGPGQWGICAWVGWGPSYHLVLKLSLKEFKILFSPLTFLVSV